MWNVVTIKGHEVTPYTSLVTFIPFLVPHKLQVLRLGHVLLDFVVGSLDDHGLQASALQEVGHGGGVAKGIVGPARARDHT